MNRALIRGIRYIVPSMLTSASMLLGLLSIHNATQGQLVRAAWFIVIASFLDALDGRIARILKAASNFGIQYDSLADMVSFGVAPAVLFIHLPVHNKTPLLAVAFIFMLAGALRLARFNATIKGFEKKNFSGLPIPVAALGAVSYIILHDQLWNGAAAIHFYKSYLVLILVLSLLMVSTVEYETWPKFTLRTLKSRVLCGVFWAAVVALVLRPQLLLFVFTACYILAGLFRWLLHFRLADIDGEDEKDPVQIGD